MHWLFLCSVQHSAPSHWPRLPDSPTGRKSKKQLSEGCSGLVPKSHRIPGQCRKAWSLWPSKNAWEASPRGFLFPWGTEGARLRLPCGQRAPKQIYVAWFSGQSRRRAAPEWGTGRPKKEVPWSITPLDPACFSAFPLSSFLASGHHACCSPPKDPPSSSPCSADWHSPSGYVLSHYLEKSSCLGSCSFHVLH